MGKGSKPKRAHSGKMPAEEESPDEEISFFSRRNYLVLAGIFLLGLFLRLHELARKPLWLDEASTNYLATQPDLMAVIAAASNDHHAPLHFITVWFVKMAGSSEFLLRLPSAAAGALTVIVIFFIARELYNERAGLIAAALLAASPYHILYSQEARMYGMAVLFVALAICMFLRAVRTGELKDWLFFGTACALAFYTHFYTGFIIAALAIAYGIVRFREFSAAKSGAGSDKASFKVPHDLRQFIAGMALAFILVIPILSSFFNQSGFFVSRTFNWGLSIENIPPQIVLMFSAYSEFIAVLFLCLMVIGLVMIGSRQKEKAVALAVVFLIPVLISMYLSGIIPFNVRYVLYLITLFLSLVAIPLAWLSEKLNAGYGTYAVVALVLVLSAFPLYAMYTSPLQEDWRTFAGNLRQVTQPGDIVAPLPWYMYLPLSYYYDNTTDATYYQNFALDEAGFRSLDNSTGSVYYVVTWDITAADPTGFSVEYLNNHTVQTAGSVNGIYLLRKVS